MVSLRGAERCDDRVRLAVDGRTYESLDEMVRWSRNINELGRTPRIDKVKEARVNLTAEVARSGFTRKQFLFNRLLPDGQAADTDQRFESRLR